MSDVNILSSAAMYAIFNPSGALIGVFEDYPTTDKFLSERAAKVPTGKLESLKLARISLDAHELATILMGQATLSGDAGADILLTPTGWFSRPDFSVWYHKVPKVSINTPEVK